MKNIDIRDSLFDEIYKLIKKDRKVILLVIDQGALGLEKIKKKFPKNILLCPISEQNIINFAAGLALAGFKPYIYLIASFLMRSLEQIKINLSISKLNIKLIGSGPGNTYASDGPTHYFTEDYGIFKNLENIQFYSTHDSNSAIKAIVNSYKTKAPCYISLEKNAFANLHSFYEKDVTEVLKGLEKLIVTRGYLSQKLWHTIKFKVIKKKIGLAVITKALPFNLKDLFKIIKKYKKIYFFEECRKESSVYESIVGELIKNNPKKKFKLFYLKTMHHKLAGNRDTIFKANKLDEKSIIKLLNE
jgi:transketolase C-terminal domain/subunit